MEQAKQAELLEMLGSADPEERLTAIRVLGEAGDVQALEILRSWLKALSAEHTALVVAVGKLKRRLHVK
jgi:HEAT repeat protein